MSSKVILDIESTGLKPGKSKIIEVAAVRVDSNGKELAVFQSLVNPYIEIPEKITKLTGIDSTMCAEAPEEYDVIQQLSLFCGDSELIGHNIKRFDMRFLKKAGFVRQARMHDTLVISRKKAPKAKSHRLAYLCKVYNLEHKSKHRALGDCRATNLLFHYYLRH